MKSDENLSKVFGVEPIREGEVITSGGDVILPDSKGVEENVIKDYDSARNNLYKLLNQGQDALYSALEIAKQSEHPRAFEVLAKLMDSMVIANEKLLELQKEIKEIDKANAPHNEQAKSITNNLFVGSTAELQKVLKDMKNDRNTEL